MAHSPAALLKTPAGQTQLLSINRLGRGPPYMCGDGDVTMSESIEHLDLALAEEFAGHAETIHRLKITDAHFRRLMEENHALWQRIQSIQNGLTPTSDDVLTTLEKERLALLDQISGQIRRAEA
jgi:uncharacterized protein YdcH (DUF465 family)